MVVYASSILQHVIKNKDGIMKYANLNVKIIVSAKKIRVGILAHVFVRIVIFKKYCWYFSDWLWWNCNCDGYCVDKKDKYCSNKS